MTGGGGVRAIPPPLLSVMMVMIMTCDRIVHSVAAALGLALLAGGCGQAPPAVEMLRLDRVMASDCAVTSGGSAMTLGAAGWIYVRSGVMPDTADTALIDSLMAREASSATFSRFEADVDSLLPPLLPALEVMGRIDGLPGQIYGTVSPYNQSVVIVDTLVYVALNHYLGEEYEGYLYFPAYMRHRKVMERMPVDVAEAWVRSRYPFPDSIAAPTLLQRMAYEGAVTAAVADMLGMADGALVMGWRPGEWDEATAHEREAWRRIVGSEMLYSDDAALIRRLTADAAASPDVSPDAPGRIGVFIGLRMVRATGERPIGMLADRSYLGPGIAAPYARLMH